MSTERGIVSVTFAGEVRRLRCELGAAPEVEEATGKSLMELAAALTASRARVNDVAAVFQAVLAVNGVDMDRTAVLTAMGEIGFEASMVGALKIISAFFVKPDGDADTKKLKARK